VKSSLHLEVSWDDESALWGVGAISTWGERIELARSHQCGPFTSSTDVRRFLTEMFEAWVAPALGHEASESLHDAYATYAP
jgi:hypothetical protein